MVLLSDAEVLWREWRKNLSKVKTPKTTDWSGVICGSVELIGLAASYSSFLFQQIMSPNSPEFKVLAHISQGQAISFAYSDLESVRALEFL